MRTGPMLFPHPPLNLKTLPFQLTVSQALNAEFRARKMELNK